MQLFSSLSFDLPVNIAADMLLPLDSHVFNLSGSDNVIPVILKAFRLQLLLCPGIILVQHSSRGPFIHLSYIIFVLWANLFHSSGRAFIYTTASLCRYPLIDPHPGTAYICGLSILSVWQIPVAPVGCDKGYYMNH